MARTRCLVKGNSGRFCFFQRSLFNNPGAEYTKKDASGNLAIQTGVSAYIEDVSRNPKGV